MKHLYKFKGFGVPVGALILFLAAPLACTGDIGGNPKSNSDAEGSGGEGGRGATHGGAGNANAVVGQSLSPGGGLRRLAVREIEATIDNLFPELAATRLHFPPDAYALFDNDDSHLSNGLAFLENAALVLGTLADQARANPKAWARVRTCAAADNATTCLGRFYDEWAPRVLRRPVQADERRAFTAVADIAKDLGGVDEALTVGLEALLRLPEFIHRVELGQGTGTSRDLQHHELLGRLAFFLWGEAPDDALTRMAVGKNLHDAAVRAAVAQAMLEDPRAERQVLDYHAQWLGYGTMAREGLGRDMWNESAALIRRVVFEPNVPYEKLLLSEETYVTPALAKHYQLPPVSRAGWAPYGQSGRLGILGHGTFLSAFSNVGDTSPIKRGKNVLDRLLCTPIELPTDQNVNVDAKPDDTECRQDFFRKVHAGSGSCKGCHQALDGIGFGLDNFDRVGVPRTFEQGKPQCKLDGQGELDGVPFSGPAGLAKALAKHVEAAPCVARQVARFYLGANPQDSEEGRAWTATLADEFDRSGRRFKPLLLSVVQSRPFAQVAPR